MDHSEILATPADGQHSAGPNPPAPVSHDHVVHFYDDDAALCANVCPFLADGIAAGESCVLIAAASHRDAIRLRLSGMGVDVAAALRTGVLTIEDANQLLMQFMVDGMPDRARFQTVVGGLLERVAALRPGRTMRAFGEMVDVLWKQGHTKAAIALEELWNELATQHSFVLLCAYSMDNFYGALGSAGFEAVCKQHSRIVHDIDSAQSA